jgi:hypothetical protein
MVLSPSANRCTQGLATQQSENLSLDEKNALEGRTDVVKAHIVIKSACYDLYLLVILANKPPIERLRWTLP